MLFHRRSTRNSECRGFTMTELLAAIVVFNLLIAGLVKLFIGQNSMVEDLEGWAEGEPVWYISQEADPMARALGIPASMSTKKVKAAKAGDDDDSEYLVEVTKVERHAGSDSANVSFQQTKLKDDDKGDDRKGGKKDDAGDEGKKDDKKDGKDEKKGKDDKKDKGKDKDKKGRGKK